MSVPPTLINTEHHAGQLRQQLFRHHLSADKAAQLPAVATTRTSASALSQADQQTFIAAYKQMINAGFLTSCVAIHADMMTHRMHDQMGPIGAQRFLPWHRVFLFTFEQQLRLRHGVSIPYWDWATDQQIPDWLQNYTPTVTGADHNPITVFRTEGADVPFGLPTTADVTANLNDGDFGTFENHLEDDLHGTVHNWVGGPMADLTTAPADPLFWLHHANVDRIWEAWRRNNPGLNPRLRGTDATLDPWADTEPQTRDLNNYNYQYDKLPV